MQLATMHDVRRRVRAVTSVRQITRAMELVAAAKLRRAQDRVRALRPYARAMEEMLQRLAATLPDAGHPLLRSREVGRVGLAFITGDRGLCGGYNGNVARMVQQLVADEAAAGHEVGLVAVGRRGRDFFRRRRYQVTADYAGLGENPSFAAARDIARDLIRMFGDGELDEVRFVYTEFSASLLQRPRVAALLPVRMARIEPGQAPAAPSKSSPGERRWGRPTWEYIYEPSPGRVLERLVPDYVEACVFHYLLEAKAAEHRARMTAMKVATNNADEMIEQLTLEANRVRQTAITREISEIVGGAEALK